jgi:pepF/M3 family oligoendopeptidase
VAACLNSVKGTAATLARRRGRESVLETALVRNRIDRATLDALFAAIDEALPMFRGYLAAKAAKLNKPQLAWWDIFAPVGGSDLRYSWTEARAFLLEKFATFSDDLAEMTRRAFDERWIDALPRDGKRVGAFCMPIQRLDESRILANFDGSFDQLSTLAHELGHAYHDHCQRGLAPLLRGSPNTLAESASIFCETLITNAALATAAKNEQIVMLEAQLCGAAQVCVDIRSRFLFESAVLERRKASELSAADFIELMRDAQSKTYGDAIDPATYHPYMWLWKPHYYAFQENFYNFPYAFGHLFALGLYARFQQQGAAFLPEYRQLLRDTAQADAADLAARFGMDIRRIEFWRASLAIVAEQARRFAAL